MRTQPTKGGGQKWKLGRNTYTLRTRFFCTSGADSYAQLVLINKISASELSRKFIKGALLFLLLVGKDILELILPPPRLASPTGLLSLQA